MLTIIAWLILRIVFAVFFVYPVYGFLRDWPAAKQTATMIYPSYPSLQAAAMILIMVVVSISILFGIYGHVGGLIALVFSLIGVHVHHLFAHKITDTNLSASVSSEDRGIFDGVKALGVVGHMSSAQKNYVIAAVSFFFMVLGTGPLSITN